MQHAILDQSSDQVVSRLSNEGEGKQPGAVRSGLVTEISQDSKKKTAESVVEKAAKVSSLEFSIDYKSDTLYLATAHLCKESHFDEKRRPQRDPALEAFL